MWDFLKKIYQFTLPGIWHSNVNKVLNLFNAGGRSDRDSLWDSLFSGSGGLSGALGNYVKTQTGSGMNQTQVEQNEWTAQREDTANQRAVVDMQAAGLNPALMYGHGSASPSVASASPAAGGLSDLIQLAMLPLTMKKVDADIKQTNAETQNISEQTRTQEQETRIRTIMADFGVQRTTTEINSMLAQIDKVNSDAALAQANISLVHSETDAQNLVNKYLDERQRAELDKIIAEGAKISVDKRLTEVRTAFEGIQKDFAKRNGFLMSSSDTLLVIAYVMKLLGFDSSDLANFIQEDLPKFTNDVLTSSHFGGPGGPTK